MTRKIIELNLSNELGNEKIAIAVIASLAQKMGFSAERVDDLKTAVGEAVINAIEHGNQLNYTLEVLIIIEQMADSLMVKVIDQAEKSMPAQPYIRRERLDNRGWGMFLIQSLMDDVTTTILPERNELCMMMHLKPS